MTSLGSLWDRVVNGAYRWVLEPAGITPGDVGWFLERGPQFVLILVLFFLFTRALVWAMSKTVLTRGRVDPMISNLVSKLTTALLMFVGFAVALMAFNINIFSLAITLGLVGAALALGLQNTVANIMGGISLVTDRPFEVGDRVKIGEFWGDVEEIGLRSTRILTARREYVIVPNRLMDEREIWNYTKRYPELRVDVPMSISYDSDRRLARSLMLQAAREHAEVLAFPRPQVVTRGHGDNGLEMELRVFLGGARNRYNVESDLLDRVKDLFDKERVEIPFPYRTIVHKAEMPPPQLSPADRTEPGAQPRLRDRKLLVATAGTTPALNKAKTIVDLARDLEADLVVSYIVPRISLVTQREGERAADIFNAAAKRHGVQVQLVVEEGVVVECIDRVVRREGCGAVLIGAPRTPVVMAWKSANVEERLRNALAVPVVVIPPSLELEPEEVEAARASLDEIAPRPAEDPAPDEGAPP